MPLAVTWSTTGWPAGGGKLGVIVISTDGGMGTADATSSSGCVVESVPSDAVTSISYVPACTPLGVQFSRPVDGFSVAPVGSPVAE